MFFGTATAESVLTIATHRLGDVVVVRCLGRIVVGHTEGLKIAVRQTGAPLVVLDLAETTAIDAAGLGVLVSLHVWAKATGMTLRLMNLRPDVEQVFEATKLKSVFAICSVPEMFDLLCRAMERRASLDGATDVLPTHGQVIATGGSAA